MSRDPAFTRGVIWSIAQCLAADQLAAAEALWQASGLMLDDCAEADVPVAPQLFRTVTRVTPAGEAWVVRG